MHVLLAPGGVLVFHEIDWSGLRSFPPAPLFQRCCALGAETLRRFGTETTMGCGLYAAFKRAGLNAPTLHLEAPIAGGADAAPWLRIFAELVRTLEPEMITLGVAHHEELAVASLGIGWCRKRSSSPVWSSGTIRSEVAQGRRTKMTRF